MNGLWGPVKSRRTGTRLGSSDGPPDLHPHSIAVIEYGSQGAKLRSVPMEARATLWRVGKPGDKPVPQACLSRKSNASASGPCDDISGLTWSAEQTLSLW